MVNLRSIDLNLLVTLEALVDEGNVTRGAARLGISQSAASHALARLRDLFHDELLIRTPHGMVPTERADEIVATLSSAMGKIERVVGRSHGFDPSTSARSFRLRVSDYVTPFLLPDLSALLRAEAPGICLDVAQFQETDLALTANELQIRVDDGRSRPVEQRVRSERLFEDEYVILMGAEHPRAHTELTLASYLRMAHIKVSPHAVGTNAIDDALARRRVARHVTLTVPSWSNLRGAVAGTDLVVAIPRRWAADPAFSTGCVWHPLPMREVRFALDIRWRSRDEHEPGYQWLRSLIRRAFTPPTLQ